MCLKRGCMAEFVDGPGVVAKEKKIPDYGKVLISKSVV